MPGVRLTAPGTPNVFTEEENHLGWFCVGDDGNQTKKETHPLLVGHTPVMVARQPEFKVRARGFLGPWVWASVRTSALQGGSQGDVH